MKIKTTIESRRERAFTIFELMVVVAALLIVAGLILPGLARCNCRAPGINCVNNLKQVALAFRIWAGDNGGIYPMQFYTNRSGQPLFADASNAFQYFQVMSNELSTPKIVICPGDTRNAATNFAAGFNNQNVSYFIGLEASETNDSMFLAGERTFSNGRPLNNGCMALTTNQPVKWSREFHGHTGNIALTDGSVSQLSPSRLRDAVAHTGVATNWLVFP